MLRNILIMIGALFGLVFLISLSAPGPNTSAKSDEHGVTAAHYAEIRNGMSYDGVVEIIGRDGIEVSRNRIEGVRGVMESIDTVMYVWKNPDGSNMNVMLQNNGVVSKAQWGLR